MKIKSSKFWLTALVAAFLLYLVVFSIVAIFGECKHGPETWWGRMNYCSVTIPLPR